MALSPVGKGWSNKNRSKRANEEQSITYAPGYLLGLRRDEIFEPPSKRNAVPQFRRTPLTPKVNASSPIRLRMPVPKSDSPYFKDLSCEDDYKQENENKYDKASVLKELAKKSRKRSTAADKIDFENSVNEASIEDGPGRKRRKENSIEIERESSAFQPFSPQATEQAASPNPKAVDSRELNSTVVVQCFPAAKKPKYKSTSLSPPSVSSNQSSSAPSQTPASTSWKTLVLPNSKVPKSPQNGTESCDLVMSENHPEFAPQDSNLELAKPKSTTASTQRTNTIRLPEIFLDDDGSLSGRGSSASTPLITSGSTSLRSSPVSPPPHQQLLTRLRRQYTSGRSPRPGESWEGIKKRVLTDTEEQSLTPPSLSRQVSHEDMDQDHRRARARVRTYLKELSAEEELKRKKEAEEQKKKDSGHDTVSSLSTISHTKEDSVQEKVSEKLTNPLLPSLKSTQTTLGPLPSLTNVASSTTLATLPPLSKGNEKAEPPHNQDGNGQPALGTKPSGLSISITSGGFLSHQGQEAISSSLAITTTSSNAVFAGDLKGGIQTSTSQPKGLTGGLSTATGAHGSGGGLILGGSTLGDFLNTGGSTLGGNVGAGGSLSTKGSKLGGALTTGGTTLDRNLGAGSSTLGGALGIGGSKLGGITSGGSTLGGGLGTGGSTLDGGLTTGGSNLGGLSAGISTLGGGQVTGGSTLGGGLGTRGSTLGGGLTTGGSKHGGGLSAGGNTLGGGLSAGRSTLGEGLSTGGSTLGGGLNTGGSTLGGGLNSGGSTLGVGLTTGGNTLGGLGTGGSMLGGGLGTRGSTLGGGLGTGGNTLGGGLGTGGNTLGGGLGTGGSILGGGPNTGGSTLGGASTLSQNIFGGPKIPSGTNSTLQVPSQSSLFNLAGNRLLSNMSSTTATQAAITSAVYSVASSGLLQNSSSLFSGSGPGLQGSILSGTQNNIGNNTVSSTSSFFGTPAAPSSSNSIFGKDVKMSSSALFAQPNSSSQNLNFNLTAVKGGSGINFGDKSGLGMKQSGTQGGFPFSPQPSMNFTTPENRGAGPGGLQFSTTPNLNFSANTQTPQLKPGPSSGSGVRRTAKATRRGGRK